MAPAVRRLQGDSSCYCCFCTLVFVASPNRTVRLQFKNDGFVGRELTLCLHQALKRQAEGLVGLDNPADASHEEAAQTFRHKLGLELEKVSGLYIKHERKMCAFFCSLEAKTDELHERVKQEELCNDGTSSYKDRIARQSAKSSALCQDPTTRQVFIALTAYLVHIDAIRNFALLNMLALLKIANNHCSKTLRDDILGRLYQEPFYHCYRLTSLVDEINSMQDAILKRCFGEIMPLSPKYSMADFAGGHDQCSSVADQTAHVSTNATDDVQTCAKDLATYCTWVNQKGEKGCLPAWVCKGCTEPSQLDSLKGDLRSVSVAPLVKGFALKLKGVLVQLELAHFLPHLIHNVQHQQRQQQVLLQQKQQQLQETRRMQQQPARSAAPDAFAHAIPKRFIAHQSNSPVATRQPHQSQQHALQQEDLMREPLRDSPGRRRHSPDRVDNHKRQCQNQHSRPTNIQRLPQRQQQLAAPTRRQRSPDHIDPLHSKRQCILNEPLLASAQAGLRRTSTIHASGHPVAGGLRPQRSCYDLRLLDLQHQGTDQREINKKARQCSVHQAALDLSYLSLAMGSPCGSPVVSPFVESEARRATSITSILSNNETHTASQGFRPALSAGSTSMSSFASSSGSSNVSSEAASPVIAAADSVLGGLLAGAKEDDGAGIVGLDDSPLMVGGPCCLREQMFPPPMPV